MPTLPSVTKIVDALYTSLQVWGQQNGAIVTVARDPFHVLEILAGNPEGYRLVVHWAGDENISDIDPYPVLDNELQFVLSYNLGLTAAPDLTLIRNSQDRSSVLQRIDDLRAHLLSVEFPDELTGHYLVYTGTKPFITPQDVPLAAYVLTFKLKLVPMQEPNPSPIAI